MSWRNTYRPYNARKRSVQLFCWNMVPTQMSWISVATLLSTMLPFIRIYHSQQSCFHTTPTLKQGTRYSSTIFTKYLQYMVVFFCFSCRCFIYNNMYTEYHPSGPVTMETTPKPSHGLEKGGAHRKSTILSPSHPSTPEGKSSH